ncbi:MAG: superinfection immunity protein [Lachnospiraceae bacterium]|nr:superinfection immunity protein [Lachnospiraceae bacterium]
MTASDVKLIYIILIIILFVVIYFIPILVSLTRNSTHSTAIFIINFFLGVTGIGWVGALVWAILDETADERNKRIQKEAAEIEAAKEQQIALSQLMLQSMTQMQMINKERFEKEENKENIEVSNNIEQHNE